MRLVLKLIVMIVMTFGLAVVSVARPKAITYSAIAESILDDSNDFSIWALEVYKATRGQPLNRETPLIIYAYYFATGEQSDNAKLEPDFLDRLAAALAFAEQNQQYEDVVRLRLATLKRMAVSHRSEPDDLALYREPLELCDRFDLKLMKARVYSELSRLARMTGHPQAASEAIESAMNILNETPNAPFPDRLNIKTKLAGYLSQYDAEDRALDVYRELAELGREHGVRQFRSDMEFNIARILAKKSREKDLMQALQHYQNAMRIDSSLGSESSIAISLIGIAEVEQKLHQEGEAIRDAQKALALFQKVGSQVWEGEAWKVLGGMHAARKDYAAAEAAFQNADRIFGEEYREDKYKVNLGFADVYAGTGRFQKAYEYLAKAHEIMGRIQKDDFQKKRAEAMNRMEVQLADEKAKVLQKANELQQKEIEFNKDLKKAVIVVATLCVVLLILLSSILRLSGGLRKANRKMGGILNNIEQGIFTLDRNLQIDPDDSWHLRHIQGACHDPQGADGIAAVFSKSDLGAEKLSLIREILRSCLGEDSIAWDLNEGNLPHEVCYTGESARIFLVHWRPIRAKGGRVERILVTMIEVSRQRELEQAVVAERVQNQKLFKIFTEARSVAATKLSALVDELSACLDTSGEPKDITFLLRRLHTCKGVARSFGLSTLSQTIHEWESTLIDMGQLDEDRSEAARELLQLYRSFQPGGESVHLEEKEPILALCQRLLPGLLLHIQQNELKLAAFSVNDRVLAWTESQRGLLEQVLPHILMNALDHGFLFPRQNLGWQRAIELSIETREQDQGYEIVIQDNGVGLDLERIGQLAQRRGFTPASDQDVTEVLFLDGVSTAEGVTETSGRGVGLSAVRSLCEQRGGRVRLQTGPQGEGSVFTIFLPKKITQTHSL